MNWLKLYGFILIVIISIWIIVEFDRYINKDK